MEDVVGVNFSPFNGLETEVAQQFLARHVDAGDITLRPAFSFCYNNSDAEPVLCAWYYADATQCAVRISAKRSVKVWDKSMSLTIL